MTINKLILLCKEDKQITLFVGIIFVLIIVLIGTSIKLETKYTQAKENQKQIVLMQNTIDKYNKLATKINAEEYKPVDKSQLDFIQTDILTKVQSHNLLLKNFDTKKESNKDDFFKTYNLTLQGNWSNLVIFLDDFSSKDALITINKLSIQRMKNDDAVECTLEYRVYVK